MAEGESSPGAQAWQEVFAACSAVPCCVWSLALRVLLGKDVNQSNDRGSTRGGSSAVLSDGQLKNRPIYL